MGTPTPTRVEPTRRRRFEIAGLVQGVGFRPFVWRLARETGLAGFVTNTPKGVTVEIEGTAAALDRFRMRLFAETPPHASIESWSEREIEPLGETGFSIVPSERAGNPSSPVLPDLVPCADCLRDVLLPGDRREGYPFTNCTNCGPRFSIVRALPYDRANTTLASFPLCPSCRAEYENPADRRFHAQPTACPACGPRAFLLDPDGRSLAAGEEALREAAAAVLAGRVVAVKGLGGFHLIVDAADEAAVGALRLRKRREEKPFALLVADLAGARSVVETSSETEALLASPEGPIVLLPRRPGGPVAAGVAPGNPRLGVFLPPTPLHHLLMREIARPVVATSGNLSDEPICTDETEALVRLRGIADLFLVHNRPIARHVDDSVAWIVDGAPALLRRARGFAPAPVLLRDEVPPILAVGAHLKNAVAVSSGRRVFVSQHVGDLETEEAFAAFERVVADFLSFYRVRPAAIAHDLHPDYLSTRWAIGAAEAGLLAGVRLAGVQHHHAHLAACLAENGVTDRPVLGVTWDGTGYGDDGTIWGGEFLLGDAAGYRRAAHLLPFRLPGGEAAVKEPRRTAFALLREAFGNNAEELADLEPVRSLSARERDVLDRMLERGTQSPVTTSAGRLFDGIAAIAGLRQVVRHEGQAAMELEWTADGQVGDGYPLPVAGGTDGDPIVLDWRPLVRCVAADVRAGGRPGPISTRFHGALVTGIVEVARRIAAPRVALAGGCFQNRILTEEAARRLRGEGFEVFLHRQVPPNDGSICLGQVAVAAARMRQGV
jgi:hydrogenase maturation protein HypF